MMMIRIYALYECSRRVLALLVGVAIGATVVACVRFLSFAAVSNLNVFYSGVYFRPTEMIQ